MITYNNNIIWFNANELTLALEYKNPKDAIMNNVNNNNKCKLQNMETNNDVKIKKHPYSININGNGLN